MTRAGAPYGRRVIASRSRVKSDSDRRHGYDKRGTTTRATLARVSRSRRVDSRARELGFRSGRGRGGSLFDAGAGITVVDPNRRDATRGRARASGGTPEGATKGMA